MKPQTTNIRKTLRETRAVGREAPRYSLLTARYTLLPVLLAVALNTAAYCGIEWKQKDISVEVKPGQGAIETAFEFSVTGNEPVAVISTKTSCGCVTLSDITGEHKPGTQGVLKARYVPRSGGGGTTAEKITVTTTDPAAPEIELRLLAYAPLTYRIEPRQVFWNTGAEPAARDVQFTDAAGRGCKPVFVYSTSMNFTAALIPPDGKSSKYIIRITPVSTTEAGGAHIFLDIDMGDGTIEKARILAAIRDQNDTKIKMLQR